MEPLKQDVPPAGITAPGCVYRLGETDRLLVDVVALTRFITHKSLRGRKEIRVILRSAGAGEARATALFRQRASEACSMPVSRTGSVVVAGSLGQAMRVLR